MVQSKKTIKPRGPLAFGIDESAKHRRTRRDRFAWHTKNLRAINTSMDRLSLSIRRAIRKEDKKTVSALTPYYALSLGMWSEVRLLKLLHERRGFTLEEIKEILSRNLIEMWKFVVEMSFRKHYKKDELTIKTLKHTKYQQYQTIKESLDQELIPVIELRNRLAHGQLTYTLCSDRTGINTQLMANLNRENIVTLQLKRRLLDHIARIIHSIAVFHPNFDKDFDKNYDIVINATEQIQECDFEAYSRYLRSRYFRGREWRKNNAVFNLED